MSIKMDLIPRPWSCHVARVEEYQPQISCEIVKVGRGKNAWRLVIKVDEWEMFVSHHSRKRDAESRAPSVMDAYTNVHYRST